MGYTHYWYNNGVDQDQWELAMEKGRQVAREQNEVELFGPMGSGSPLLASDISFNGNERDDDDYETFFLPEKTKGLDPFTFCKTARKPYDVVVTAVLAAVRQYAGYKFQVSSDGDPEDWKDGLALASFVLGEEIDDPITNEEEDE